MPTLPIPMFSSLVLGFLLLRMVVSERRHGPLGLLLGICAVQGVIISLVQHYEVGAMRPVQPIVATLIPPVAWIAFRTTAVRRLGVWDAVHVAGPLAVIAALAAEPSLIDALVPLLFLAYGAAILIQGAKGADALPRLRLEAGDLPVRIWQIIGAALIGSAVTDVLIVAALAAGMTHLPPWIISIYTSAMLLVVGGLGLSGALAAAPEAEEPAPGQAITEADAEIVARLERLMAEEKPYLNPDLTLSQLSRKLLVPVKPLSSAINRVTGENVSRYINKARIAAAQEALASGESVTAAMLSSGFNTKSNFNREFLRVVGQSPSDWLDARG